MAFPSGPYTDGQTHTEGGIAYSYSATEGAWLKVTSAGGAGVDDTRLLSGSVSISGGGSLAADRTIQLVNDSAAPAPNTHYGSTNTAGNPKGFHSNNNFFWNNAASNVSTARSIDTINSLTGGGDLNSHAGIQLVNDVASPGPDMAYGTDGSGTGNRIWKPKSTVVDPNGVPVTRRFGSSNSIINLNIAGNNDTLERSLTPRLNGDVAAPGSDKYWGTNSAGTKGWYNARIPGWQRLVLSNTSVLNAGTTAMNRFSNGGGSGHFAFNATAVTLIPNRVNRVRFTIKTTEPNRFMSAWVGSLSAILIGGTTDSSGFFTGSAVLAPTSALPISLRNGSTQSATLEYCEIFFMVVD